MGAGVAGLTCAYRLMQAGVPVRVFEGQNRIGGRMWSLRDHFPEGLVCELGGELVDSGHETIRGLCDELGLLLDDFEEDDPKLAKDVWFFDGRRMKDAEVVEAFRPIAAKIDEAWETVTGEIVTHAEPNGARRSTGSRSPSGSTAPAPPAGSGTCSTSATRPSTAARSTSSRPGTC